MKKNKIWSAIKRLFFGKFSKKSEMDVIVDSINPKDTGNPKYEGHLNIDVHPREFARISQEDLGEFKIRFVQTKNEDLISSDKQLNLYAGYGYVSKDVENIVRVQNKRELEGNILRASLLRKLYFPEEKD